MLVDAVLIVMLLSQPTVKPEELDLHYRECADMYNIYLEIKNKDIVQGAFYGERLRYLCKPTNIPSSDI